MRISGIPAHKVRSRHFLTAVVTALLVFLPSVSAQVKIPPWGPLGAKQEVSGSRYSTVESSMEEYLVASKLLSQDSSSVDSLDDGIVNALRYSGVDIGEKVTKALRDKPCAHVFIPAGTYPFSTSIKKPRCSILEGAGNGRGRQEGQTTLLWRGAGAAIIVGDQDSGTSESYQQGTMKSFALSGAGTGVGIFLGGDPVGKLNPSNDGADTETLEHLYVGNFANNLQYGNHSYLTVIFSSQLSFASNAGIYYPSGTSDSGENIRISDSKIFNSHIGILNPGGANFNGFGTSFDYNDVAVEGSSFACSLCHFEQKGAPAFVGTDLGLKLHLDGSYIVLGDSKSKSESFVLAPGGPSQQINLYFAGTAFYSSRVLDKLLDAPKGLSRQSLVTVLAPDYEAGHAFRTVTNSINMEMPGLLFFDPSNTGLNRLGRAFQAPQVTGQSMELRGLSSDPPTGELINPLLVEDGSNFAVAQDRNGATRLNSAQGNVLTFAIRNAAILGVSPTGLTGALHAPSGSCPSIGDLLPSHDGHLSQCDSTAHWYRIH